MPDRMEIKKIYFDMDNVLVDFDRGVDELAGFHIVKQDVAEKMSDEEMWHKIREVEHYYDRLEPAPGAKELFDAVYEVYRDRCEILTGIPKPRRGILHAAEDKIKWVRRLLSPEIVVNICFKEEKKNFCTGPDCVLIDDLPPAITAWEACGGTGILHRNAEETMEKLRQMGILA